MTVATLIARPLSSRIQPPIRPAGVIVAALVSGWRSASAEAVDEAKRLIVAFEEAQAEGRMAFSFEGSMVDAPHLNRARKLVERAAQIDPDSKADA